MSFYIHTIPAINSNNGCKPFLQIYKMTAKEVTLVYHNATSYLSQYEYHCDSDAGIFFKFVKPLELSGDYLFVLNNNGFLT